MRETCLVVLCLTVLGTVGCGNDAKDGVRADAALGPDAFVPRDAPATATVEVTVSGRATEQTVNGSGALAAVTIQAFRNADETTPIATTTTDGFGDYSLVIQTNGEAIDGFLKATKAGFKETYLYPPYPLTADFDQAIVIMVTPQSFDALSTLAQGNQQEGNGLVGCIVTDGSTPVAGATVSSSPAATAYRYNDTAGTTVFPSSQATSTHSDGVAYMFNLPPGPVTVSAMKTGLTFRSHALKVRADQLTTTVIVP
jgi:hypothetical protein